MRKLILASIVLLSAVGSMADGTPSNQTFSETIKVDAQAQQTFYGYGSSQPRIYRINSTPATPRIYTPYTGISDALLDSMIDKAYGELGATILRLWTKSDQDLSTMLTEFDHDYVANGLLKRIQRRGIKIFFLSPGRGPNQPTDDMTVYAQKLAQFIIRLKSDYKVNINVTGIANEPTSFTSVQIVTIITALRAELDKNGFQTVQIIAPEENCAGCRIFDEHVSAIKANQDAWDGMSAIASHSYNVAADASVAQFLRNSDGRFLGKQYWMTEAGGMAFNGALDDGAIGNELAASLAARFLNDMNHLVQYWLWFIGFGDASDAGRSMSLVRPDIRNSQAIVTSRFQYMKQLRTAFPDKTIFHHSKSSQSGDMTWTYGQKPPFVASVGQRPDGKWAIGVVNITDMSGIINPKIASFYSARNYQLKFDLSELPIPAGSRFALQRSNGANGANASNQNIIVGADGSLQIQVNPRELVTLIQV